MRILCQFLSLTRVLSFLVSRQVTFIVWEALLKLKFDVLQQQLEMQFALKPRSEI
jgi:hypothetical protein